MKIQLFEKHFMGSSEKSFWTLRYPQGLGVFSNAEHEIMTVLRLFLVQGMEFLCVVGHEITSFDFFSALWTKKIQLTKNRFIPSHPRGTMHSLILHSFACPRPSFSSLSLFLLWVFSSFLIFIFIFSLCTSTFVTFFYHRKL